MVFENLQQTEFRSFTMLALCTNQYLQRTRKAVCYLQCVKIQLEEYISLNVYLKD